MNDYRTQYNPERWQWLEPDRPIDPPELDDLTDAEVNAVQAEVERIADLECDDCSPRFRSWLNSKNGARTRQDYQQFRAALLTQDEQIEIEISLGIRE
jgi:hypothetical protein